MRTVTFHVPGKPQGKAIAGTFRNKHTGNSMSVTPDNTVLYENLIKDQYLNHCHGMYLERGVPVTLRIVVADALNGVAYHDDTQIVYVAAKKAYSAVEGLDITVEEYTER